jgi:hypothetical protein
VYGGDGNYNGSTSNVVTQVVNKASSSTSLTSLPNPSNYLQAVTFTATVAPSSATGSVTFYDSGTQIGSGNLSGGSATLTDSSLSSGTHSITAVYSGDSNYNTSTSPILTQTVNPVLVSISVSPQGLSVAVGVTQQYTAEGSYNDGSQQDLTTSPSLTWASSTPTVATITSSGLADAVGSGPQPLTSTITATVGSIVGSSTLSVYQANTFFVAVNGNDSWSGHLSAPNAPVNPTDGPLASPAEAQLKVRSANNQQNSITVVLRAGTYYLALSPTNPGTLVFNNTADSGTSTAGITWQNYPNERPVISGGVPVTSDPVSGVGLHLTWTNPTGNLWQATLNPSNLTLQNFEYLYYNGQRRLRSRIHDNGTSTYPSIGYFMQNGQCVGTPSTPAGQPSPTLASCNLGTFLRVTNTVAPTDPLGGGNCPYATGTVNGVTVQKCIDRFVYSDTSGGDPIKAWTNLNGTYTGHPDSPCTNTTNSYPTGDVELTLIDA